MKNKLLITLILFLLLIPFRLPISILFIKFFQWIIGTTTSEVIPNGILATNVILTKMVYNIALSSTFLYNIEMFSREKLNRWPMSVGGKEAFFWWTLLIGILLFTFIIADMISVHDIFYANKK